MSTPYEKERGDFRVVLIRDLFCEPNTPEDSDVEVISTIDEAEWMGWINISPEMVLKEENQKNESEDKIEETPNAEDQRQENKDESEEAPKEDEKKQEVETKKDSQDVPDSKEEDEKDENKTDEYNEGVKPGLSYCTIS